MIKILFYIILICYFVNDCHCGTLPAEHTLLLNSADADDYLTVSDYNLASVETTG